MFKNNIAQEINIYMQSIIQIARITTNCKSFLFFFFLYVWIRLSGLPRVEVLFPFGGEVAAIAHNLLGSNT